MTQGHISAVFGAPIHGYSRAEAIEDGALIDLNEAAPDVCRQHFKYPIACTCSVWALIQTAINNRNHCNDLNGVVHDILTMARFALKPAQDRFFFTVIITGTGRQKYHQFKMHVGPGDEGEPVITLSFPGED
jgi:hypothetical protein